MICSSVQLPIPVLLSCVMFGVRQVPIASGISSPPANAFARSGPVGPIAVWQTTQRAPPSRRTRRARRASHPGPAGSAGFTCSTAFSVAPPRRGFAAAAVFLLLLAAGERRQHRTHEHRSVHSAAHRNRGLRAAIATARRVGDVVMQRRPADVASAPTCGSGSCRWRRRSPLAHGLQQARRPSRTTRSRDRARRRHRARLDRPRIDTHATPGSPRNPYADPDERRLTARRTRADRQRRRPRRNARPGRPREGELHRRAGQGRAARKKVAAACGQLAVDYTHRPRRSRGPQEGRAAREARLRRRRPRAATPWAPARDRRQARATRPRHSTLYERACTAGERGLRRARRGLHVRPHEQGPDGAKAVDYLKKACALGDRTACLQVPMLQTASTSPRASPIRIVQARNMHARAREHWSEARATASARSGAEKEERAQSCD